MLALAFARWICSAHPEHSVHTVSFRGGPMLTDFVEFGSVHVLLDPHETWDHDTPPDGRLPTVTARAAAAPAADVMLAVSVAAAQCLPYLPEPKPPLATWSVERGEDLHWLHGPLRLKETTLLWLAGSVNTSEELRDLLDDAEVHLAPEFVDEPPLPDATTREHYRRSLDAPADGLLVLGVGISTMRKGPDLFIEAAVQSRRTLGSRDRFVWIGGENDDLFPRLLSEVDRLCPEPVRFLGNVEDVVPWLAAADVLLHPARLDAFPLVCLHSALAGTPVVGFSGVGGLPEMFGDSFIGAPYPDLSGLVRSLDTLRDPATRTSVAEAQRERVRSGHTTGAVADQVLSQLHQAAQNGSP